MDASTDHGTVLEDGECAMVTMNGMTEIGLLVPGEDKRQNGNVPDMMLFVTACAIRAMKDPSFVSEQIEWMMAQRPN